MISTAHTAAHLLESHFKTLVNDTVAWKELISDDIVWELPYAPAIGHPLLLKGSRVPCELVPVCRGRFSFS